jgi:dTDP-glucose pyrophosphorylase
MGFVGPAAALLRKDQHVNWQFWIVLGDNHFWSSKTVISKVELNRIDD